MSIGVQGIGFYILRPYPDTSISMLVHLQTQGPHSQSLMTGGGGSDRGSYFIPKKITSKFVYPKKSLLFLTYPKKSLLFLAYPKKSLTDSPFFTTPKNPSVFFCNPKIPASFIDPKNHFWPKFWTQKNHSDPPPPRH